MAPSQKMMELLSSLRGKIKGREFSRARELKNIPLVQKEFTKRFLATSPVFMRKYGKAVSDASHLIFANLKKLRSGEVIQKNGFVIRKESTGKYVGNNANITLSVSFKGKTCFVKLGTDSGRGHFVAYEKAREFFKKHNNTLHGFGVEVVPYHLLYLKTNTKKAKAIGVAVSDFFPKEKVTLVSDIEEMLGKSNFKETHLGQALSEIQSTLAFKEGVLDAGTHNCFFDEVKRKIYFFDLWAR